MSNNTYRVYCTGGFYLVRGAIDAATAKSDSEKSFGKGVMWMHKTSKVIKVEVWDTVNFNYVEAAA